MKSNFELALYALKNGKVIAYPTESVFGLGCDPDDVVAIQNLLKIKQRSEDKGLILVASNYQQLLPYIDESQLSEERLTEINSSWPDVVTWIMPASDITSPWVRGEFSSVAVRVTQHKELKALCAAFGKPIISTSANLSGLFPCLTDKEVAEQMGDKLDVILLGKTGGRTKPSEIRDAQTLQILRKG